MSRVLGVMILSVAVVVSGYRVVTAQAPAGGGASSAGDVARGRYIVDITGCNDCHTAGYAEAGGKAADTAKLKGDVQGHHGPWGTTYGTNLRLTVGTLSEVAWVARAKTLMARPPMPWFNVRAMTEADLRAVHRYIKSLPGDAGSPAPAFVPPGQVPKPPYVQYPGAK
jgi:mono/diheme cytochrome c family protein